MMVFWVNTVVFGAIAVAFGANTVVFWANSVAFGGKYIGIFGKYSTLVLLHPFTRLSPVMWEKFVLFGTSVDKVVPSNKHPKDFSDSLRSYRI